jgi:hypothetical protein
METPDTWAQMLFRAVEASHPAIPTLETFTPRRHPMKSPKSRAEGAAEL